MYGDLVWWRYCGDEEVRCGWQSWVAPAQPRRLTNTARDIGGQSQAATTQPKGLAKAYLAALSWLIIGGGSVFM